MTIKIMGKDLEITPASFEAAMELQDALSAALTSEKISLDLKALGSIAKDEEGQEDASGDVGDIVSALLRLVKSKRLRDALFSCAERALYDKQKVNKDFFEKPENWGVYYPIMVEVLKVNVGPFIGGLFGLFQGLDLAGIAGNLRQK